MPPKTALIYLWEKYRHETQWETYIADMLWAPANGKQFKDSKRYSELIYKPNNKPQATGEDILSELVNTW